MEKIGNVVICYQNEEEVIKYAEQLNKQSLRAKIKLYVVINKKGTMSCNLFEKKLQEFIEEYKIIDLEKNIGYLNGLLIGAKYALQECNYEWLIFSNTDILIPDINFFENMVNRLRGIDKAIWAVGPSIYAANQEEYSNPYMLFRPSKWEYIKTNIALTFPEIFDLFFGLKKKSRKRKKNIEVESGFVYAIHGSFMILRKQLIEIIMDRPAWELLYDEESYISEIVHMNNKKIYFEKELLVKHLEGMSTGKTKIRWKYKIMKQSNKRILKEFY